MKNFTFTLTAVALLSIGVQAQTAVSPASLSGNVKLQSEQTLRSERPTAEQRRQGMKKNIQKVAPGPMRSVAAPGNYELIEPADGDEVTYIKKGMSYGYSWMTGIITQTMDGALSPVIKSEDGKKLYIQGPFFLDTYTEESWIEGDIDGDVVTFKFPQLVEEDLDEEEPEYDVYGYALKLQFKVEDEETQEGWYYTTENQEYKFRLEADGTLTSLEEVGTMIGYCNWIEADDENDESGWAWQATGDVYTSMSPNTYKELEVPEDVTFEEWQLINGITSRAVKIGVKDNTMYIKGLMNKSGMTDAAVTGIVDGDKVVIKDAQYLGEYWNNRTTAWFIPGKTMNDPEYGKYMEIAGEMTFTWDKEKNVIQSDGGAFCISSVPDKIIYYVMCYNPYLTQALENPVVKALPTPILFSFYDVDEEYDYDAEMNFYLPTIDSDKQILNTDYIYYEVFMDGDLFTFYNDEYELPEGVTEMTEVPYGYYSEDTYDFDAYGNQHGFIFHTRGFKSLGVRAVYKTDAETVYSDMLYAPGYAPTEGVEGVNADKTVSSIRYYDLSGRAVTNPEPGIYVRQTVFSDGTTRTSKVVRK